MPPSAHWGKRPRGSDGNEPFVRFRELSPAAKMERRREERAEKKERDRTLAYFKSVQRALEAQSGGGGDAGATVAIVDGFFSELLKLLKADPTFYVLRHGTVCRVIEMALVNAPLLHVKSLLYVFLGNICDLMISPVASFTLETLLASLSQGLSALAETMPEGLEAELTEGGVGTHTGSGVPSSATLLRSMTEELCEHAEDLIVHDIGGRALRSVVLMLGGRAIRQAPQPRLPIAFPTILGTLAEAVMKALEDGYGREYNTTSPAESWIAAVQTPATSLVVQSLLRVSNEGSVVDKCVRQRIEALTYKGKPLLHHLLADPLGCHVFQSFIQVPPPVAVIEAGDTAAMRATPAASTSTSTLRNSEKEAPADKNVDSEELLVPGGAESCCWSRAAELVLVEVDNLLKPSSDLVAQTSYVLQDLVLYAPTALHLQWLWRRLLSPRLLLFFDVPALTAVLVQMVKRCAFEGVLLPPPTPTDSAVQLKDADTTNLTSTVNEVSHHGTVLPADVVAMLRKEAALHIRYSPVPLAFQSAVCVRICELAKQRSIKGTAQYLLVDAALSEKGYEVARYLLHLHPSTSKLLQHSLDRLRREDLLATLRSQKGSQFMQQYIKVAALEVPNSNPDSAGKADDAKSPLMRLFRRLQSSLAMLIYDKYAAFMIETLYECASFGVKEALVKALVPIYQDMHTLTHSSATATTSEKSTEQAPQELATVERGEETAVGEEAEVAPPSSTQQRFIAYKVMSKCCVEQYVHRKEDWTKLAMKQCHVQQLLRRMLLSE